MLNPYRRPQQIEDAGCGGGSDQQEEKDRPSDPGEGCAQAEQQLRQAGISYRKVFAEENPDLTVRYGVR